MGTPINPLERSADELYTSDILEEQQLGEELRGRMDQMTADIKPLLKYLLHGGEFYTVVKGDLRQLQVTRDGEWVIFKPKAPEGEHPWEQGPHLFTSFPIQKVLTGLVELTARAEKAREERLNSIKDARTKLQEIEAILNR